ncbi:FtsX-like permease family protein [Nocardia sp. NPDC052001]|uniref:FtsX-like permease family protein n=1 Tax=Nocardia sp. NPDC052001 TaxID=3154853 RepID=UPI00343ED6AC
MLSAWDRLRFLSIRDLLVHRGRALASIAVVAVSTALLVTVLCIIGSIDQSIDRVAAGLGGNAVLEVSGASDSGFPAAVRDEVGRVAGVTAAVPVVRTAVSTARGTVLLLGTDATAAALDSPIKNELTGHAAALTSVKDGVLVGPDTGFAVGERIALRGGEVTVAGVLDSPEAARFNGGRYLLAPLALAQRAAGKSGVLDSVLIIGDGGADALRPGVSKAVAGRAVVTESSAEASKSSNGVMLIRFTAVAAAGMAFLVAGFLIYTAMGMAIAQRRPVISMLRSLGGRRLTLVGDLLLETAVLSALGALLGAGLGVLLGRYAIERLPDLFLQAVSARIEFIMPVWAIPLAVIVAVLVCVGAAGLAARQVYRVSPVEALAPVGVSVADVVRPRLRIAAGVAAVVIGIGAFVATRQPGIAANAGITTMFTAEVLLGFALGVPIVRAAAWVASRFGSAGELAAEAIRRSPKRAWATLMTVSVAVAATFAISAGNTNAVDSTKDSFAALRGADVWVSTTQAGTFPTGPLLATDLPERLRALPDVAQVVEGQAGYVALGGKRAMAFGLAPGAASPLLAAVDSKVRQAVLDGQGVIMSSDLSDALKVEVGESVSMPTATGERAITVLATVPFFSGLNGAIGMALPNMREWFARQGASTLELHAAPGIDPDRLLTEVQGVLPAGTLAYTGAAAVQGFGDSLNQATRLNHLIWIIVVIISAVALINTLLLSVLERRRELGVLRAIGSSRRLALAIVLAEAGAIGITGGVLGLLFGSVEQVIADLASARAWNVDVEFVPVPAAFTLAVGALVICLVGSLIPAWRVARMNIIEAIGAD